MKKWLLVIMVSLFLWGCQSVDSTEIIQNEPELISPEEAKAMMDANDSIILVDVRTLSEYQSGHIEGALLLPLDTISTQAESVIPDKEAVYIIYCRSGNRSSQAVSLLYSMGYISLYDLGGIIDWPYDIVT
jgi:rhodanese-related sulfurtransferase